MQVTEAGLHDRECIELLRWALPRLGMRWRGFRRPRQQVCKRIARRIRALELEGPADYRRRLESDPGEWAVLDTLCRVTISRWMRDRETWWHLAKWLGARAASCEPGSTLEAWSAGCASGEEPWTLRLLWDLEVAPRHPERALDVLATDVDEQLLERARRAVYAASSVKEVPLSWHRIAFEPLDEGFRLRDRFRHGVRFRLADVRRDPPEDGFVVILCRNLVYTYMDESLQREATRRLTGALCDGGLLVIGAHEEVPREALKELEPLGGNLLRRRPRHQDSGLGCSSSRS